MIKWPNWAPEQKRSRHYGLLVADDHEERWNVSVSFQQSGTVRIAASDGDDFPPIAMVIEREQAEKMSVAEIQAAAQAFVRGIVEKRVARYQQDLVLLDRE